MSKRFGFGFGGAYGRTFDPACYESHPPLKIGGFNIYGGSCSCPVVIDADIYVGLDHSMAFNHTAYPWETPGEGVEFLFHITDMRAPKDANKFTEMIGYLATQLKLGKKIHVGCIGGHGRTGTVLAALVKYVDGNLDATAYVREHYCKKAVESEEQIDFLERHFNITPAPPTKVSRLIDTGLQAEAPMTYHEAGLFGGKKKLRASKYVWRPPEEE